MRRPSAWLIGSMAAPLGVKICEFRFAICAIAISPIGATLPSFLAACFCSRSACLNCAIVTRPPELAASATLDDVIELACPAALSCHIFACVLAFAVRSASSSRSLASSVCLRALAMRSARSSFASLITPSRIFLRRYAVARRWNGSARSFGGEPLPLASWSLLLFSYASFFFWSTAVIISINSGNSTTPVPSPISERMRSMSARRNFSPSTLNASCSSSASIAPDPSVSIKLKQSLSSTRCSLLSSGRSAFPRRRSHSAMDALRANETTIV
mmetsp:Transcript_31529/g.102734  ORF Transcript_31529/g.102734 Transcript_31529/m.102734 type:complete len:272 (+) Transcript_31529:3095-3910(+)